MLSSIEDHSVDMVLCDLPYGVTGLEWDVILPMEDLFRQYRRVLRQNANVVLFCQQPFTTLLMNTAFKSEFSHVLYWIKNTKTRAKSSKVVPLSRCEEILVFRVNKSSNKDLHAALRRYFTSELSRSGYSVKELENEIPNRSAHHWFRFSSDFRIPTEENYKRLQEITRCFDRPYQEIRESFDKERNSFCFYNPEGDNCNVLFYDTPNSKDREHPTQKPVDLLERLIRTYCPERGTVLDSCMGSGSTGCACIRTGRRFIGIEKDDRFFNIAQRRIANAEQFAQVEIEF